MWPTGEWGRLSLTYALLAEFTTALERIFQHTMSGREAACSLIKVQQGERKNWSHRGLGLLAQPLRLTKDSKKETTAGPIIWIIPHRLRNGEPAHLPHSAILKFPTPRLSHHLLGPRSPCSLDTHVYHRRSVCHVRKGSCFYCGKVGHQVMSCPVKPPCSSPAGPLQVRQNLIVNYPPHYQVKTTLHLNDDSLPVELFIDFGSDANFINLSLVGELGISQLPGHAFWSHQCTCSISKFQGCPQRFAQCVSPQA